MSTRSSTPDRVAIETLSGSIRAGSVVGAIVEADAGGFDRVLRVDVDGSIYRVDEDNVGTPDDAVTATRQ